MRTIYVGGERHLFACSLGEAELRVEDRVDAGALPSFMAFAPSHGTAYVVNEREDAIGVLRLEGERPVLIGKVASPGGPAYVSVDRSERWVLAANYGGGTVRLWPILDDGTLGPLSDEQRSGAHPHCVLSDPTNAYVLVTNKGSDTIACYRFDSQRGKLWEGEPFVVPLARGSGPRHLAFHPQGHRAYLVDELDCTVVTLAVEGASLRPLQVLSTLPGPRGSDDSGADLHVSPDGRFVYVSNRGHDSIAIFKTSDDGLALVSHESTRGRTPRNFCLVGDDRLLVANQESSNIVGFERNRETGGLSLQFVAPVGEKAYWVGPPKHIVAY
ncbi:MAG: lactonase family protein [Myxococcales bacterium]|jgi:6-phosphogluconolactonase|nr:lactonase family protein [Myxococcales bacterium]